jgi:hypothetical protein
MNKRINTAELMGTARAKACKNWLITQQNRLITEGEVELCAATKKLITAYQQGNHKQLRETAEWSTRVARSIVESCRFGRMALPALAYGRAEVWVVLEQARLLVRP